MYTNCNISTALAQGLPNTATLYVWSGKVPTKEFNVDLIESMSTAELMMRGKTKE